MQHRRLNASQMHLLVLPLLLVLARSEAETFPPAVAQGGISHDPFAVGSAFESKVPLEPIVVQNIPPADPFAPLLDPFDTDKSVLPLGPSVNGKLSTFVDPNPVEQQAPLSDVESSKTIPQPDSSDESGQQLQEIILTQVNHGQEDSVPPVLGLDEYGPGLLLGQAEDRQDAFLAPESTSIGKQDGTAAGASGIVFKAAGGCALAAGAFFVARRVATGGSELHDYRSAWRAAYSGPAKETPRATVLGRAVGGPSYSPL